MRNMENNTEKHLNLYYLLLPVQKMLTDYIVTYNVNIPINNKVEGQVNFVKIHVGLRIFFRSLKDKSRIWT